MRLSTNMLMKKYWWILPKDLPAIDEISDGLGVLVEEINKLGCDNLSMGGFSMGGHQAIHTGILFYWVSWFKSMIKSSKPSPFYYIH